MGVGGAEAGDYEEGRLVRDELFGKDIHLVRWDGGGCAGGELGGVGGELGRELHLRAWGSCQGVCGGARMGQPLGPSGGVCGGARDAEEVQGTYVLTHDQLDTSMTRMSFDITLYVLHPLISSFILPIRISAMTSREPLRHPRVRNFHGAEC